MERPGPCQQIADTFDMITPHVLHKTAEVKITNINICEGTVFKEKPNELSCRPVQTCGKVEVPLI